MTAKASTRGDAESAIARNQSSLIVMPGLTRHPASFDPRPTCRAKVTAPQKSVLHMKSGASFRCPTSPQSRQVRGVLSVSVARPPSHARLPARGRGCRELWRWKSMQRRTEIAIYQRFARQVDVTSICSPALEPFQQPHNAEA